MTNTENRSVVPFIRYNLKINPYFLEPIIKNYEIIKQCYDYYNDKSLSLKYVIARLIFL